MLLPVHLQRALSTTKNARKKQSENMHHFPNVHFQVTFSLQLPMLLLRLPIITERLATMILRHLGNLYASSESFQIQNGGYVIKVSCCNNTKLKLRDPLVLTSSTSSSICSLGSISCNKSCNRRFVRICVCSEPLLSPLKAAAGD